MAEAYQRPGSAQPAHVPVPRPRFYRDPITGHWEATGIAESAPTMDVRRVTRDLPVGFSRYADCRCINISEGC